MTAPTLPMQEQTNGSSAVLPDIAIVSGAILAPRRSATQLQLKSLQARVT
ncbi:hypothetical protein [Lysobacter gummosus]|uniref:Uncharacterized protein n=1 Tax=Lysobacter gummosus TaxID=262324 RepID=A0ABY3XE95_9GAMM|nr:hypothetical protein [Lysobacter gummosus]UNP29742.1 hypothetical protein MOV92_00185 [Lysobacter gummosus]